MVDDISARQGGVTVAYAGTALIYPLFGSRSQNRVVYLRLSPDDRLGPVPFRPGEEQYLSVVKFRRSRFDEAFWLRQLDREGVELLYLVTDGTRGGAAHELASIRRHPERFRTLYRKDDVLPVRVSPPGLSG